MGELYDFVKKHGLDGHPSCRKSHSARVAPTRAAERLSGAVRDGPLLAVQCIPQPISLRVCVGSHRPTVELAEQARRISLADRSSLAIEVHQVGAKPQLFTVVGTDMAFKPAQLRASGGEVTFRLGNSGRLFHELAGERAGSALGRVSASPGQAAEFTVKLEPGDYELTCREPGHYAAGMRGSLHVR